MTNVETKFKKIKKLRPAVKDDLRIWPASKKVWPPLHFIIHKHTHSQRERGRGRERERERERECRNGIFWMGNVIYRAEEFDVIDRKIPFKNQSKN